MQCIVCNGVFEAKRADAVYCSAKCRKAGSRVKCDNKCDTVTDNTASIVTDNSLPANFGQPDCQCRHCQSNRASGSKFILNHGPYKRSAELAGNEFNRVSLPGDVDYGR